jgi:diaminopimelate epimerase
MIGMNRLPFWKMHGAGNDFVVLASEDADASWGALAERICDRHYGVGADGLIVTLPSNVADRRMRIFNADGSEAEMCGNGIRCLVKFVLDQGLVDPPGGEVRIETAPGVLSARASSDGGGEVQHVRVSMGVPTLDPEAVGARIAQQPPVIDFPLDAAGAMHEVTLVSMGNPHAVLFTDAAPAAFELDFLGPAIEHHPLFEHRTNVEVVRVVDRSHLEMRVWERGVGETLACGSGACAAIVAARLRGAVGDRAEVALPGGTLDLEWDGAGEVTLEGPVVKVFASVWDDPDWP